MDFDCRRAVSPPSPPSLRSWSLRMQRQGRWLLNASLHYCNHPEADCVCAHTCAPVHALYVLCSGRQADGGRGVARFSLLIYIPINHVVNTPSLLLPAGHCIFSVRLSLLHRSIIPNTQILKIHRLLVAFGFNHWHFSHEPHFRLQLVLASEYCNCSTEFKYKWRK